MTFQPQPKDTLTPVASQQQCPTARMDLYFILDIPQESSMRDIAESAVYPEEYEDLGSGYGLRVQWLFQKGTIVEAGRILFLTICLGVSAGNAPRSLWVHPDGEHIVYPFGIKVAIQKVKDPEPEYLEGHSNVISTVALSKTGKYVGSGQINHMGFKPIMAVINVIKLFPQSPCSAAIMASVFVWDWSTKKVVLFHESHKVRVESVAFSSCENYVISLGGRDDANVVVYDLNTSEAICGTFSSNRNAGDALTLAALNLRGICYLSGGVYTLKVWTLNPKNRAVSSVDVTLRKIKRKITCIEVDDEDMFAWCGTSTGDLMKVKLNFSKDLTNFFPVFPPTLVACYAKHPKGKGNPNNVALWNSGVRCMILLGDRKIIGSGDGTIELVEEKEPLLDTMNKTSKLTTPTFPLFKVVKHAEVGSFVTSMQLYGKNEILIGTIKCEMFIMDLDEFHPKLVMTCHTSTIYDIAFPHGYSHVFATASKDDVRVWSVDQSKELLRITVPNFTCSNILFSYDGKAIWTSWNDGNIRAFTPQSGKLITTIFDAHNKGVSAIAATKDGKKILSGGIEGQIRIWELKGHYQKLISVLKEHKGPVSAIDISPSDSEAASASTDGTCIIWDLQKCVRIAILFSQTLFMSVKYHPSGCQIITCGTNRQIGYWEVFDGSLIREVEGSISAALNALDISRDGNFFITGGNDHYVKVWLYKEGITTHIGLGHPAVITAAAIAPDCSHIVSCSADGAIFVWKSPHNKQLPEGESKDTQMGKDENIKVISQEQSIRSVSQPKDDNTKQKKSEGETKLQTPQTGGSVKCYCKGECQCKADVPAQSPKSRIETEAAEKVKRAEGEEQSCRCKETN